jgi:hypothetical protein
VPKEFDIVETKPGSGLTKGAAYVARYGAGSAVQYSEAIFICAEVKYEATTANWVGGIFVDSTVAQEAGRQVWGLPKQMAQFEWSQPSASPAPHNGDGFFPGKKIVSVRITTAANSSSTGIAAAGAAGGDLIGAFNYTVPIIPIPFMSQTVATLSLNNSGAGPGVLLSHTHQSYTLKLLGDVEAVVPDSSPIGAWMPMKAGGGGPTKMGAKIEMSDGVFNMTDPVAI